MAKSTKTGGFSKSKSKAFVKQLDAQINAIDTNLKNLLNSLNDLQKGDGTISYWSGDRAYAWITSALKHYDHDRYILEQVTNCRNLLDSLVKYGDPM